MGLSVEIDVHNLRHNRTLVRSAAGILSRNLRDRGRQNIAGGIRDRHKWAKNFITEVKYERGGFTVNAYLKPGFLHGFEQEGGMISRGKPFLWIPIPPLRVRAERYRGRMFEPPGTRVLVRPKDGRFLYAGASSVTNKRRFRLFEIARDEAQKFIDYLTGA